MSKKRGKNQDTKLGWRGLGAIMIVQMLAIALIPLVVVAVAVTVSQSRSIQDLERGMLATRQEMVAELGEHLQSEAAVTMGGIRTYLDERIHDVKEWVNAPIVRRAAKDAATQAEELGLTALSVDEIEARMAETRALADDPELTRYLADIFERQPAFTEVFFTDAHGYNVAYSNMTSDFVQAGEGWWDTAWEDGFYLGEPEYDDSAGVYAVEVCARIDDADGTPLGVLKAVLDIKAVQDLATVAAEGIEGSTVRLFDRNGVQIADTSSEHDPALIMTEEGNLLHRNWAVAQHVIESSQTDGYLLDQQDLDGQTVVVGYALVAGDEDEEHEGHGHAAEHRHGLEEFGWTVTVAQPEEVALATLAGLDEQVSELEGVRKSVVLLLLVVGGLTAAGTIVAAVIVSRRIARPIASLASASQRIAAGDLNATVQVDRRNEIGQLQDAFTRMAAQLSQILENERAQREHLEQTVAEYMEFVASVARGDLTTRLSLNGDGQKQDPLTVLGHNLNEMVNNLSEMTARTKEAASALSAQSAEILATTTQQATGAAEQSAAVSQATTTVDEIKTIAEQLVARSRAVADTSQRTVEISSTGKNTVQEAVAGMSQIKARVDVIEENILALSERTNQIGEIIDTVNAIAAQSNMLALNASVEAARAGEQGKGFAVVAQEVRDLAERSTQATAQVKAILSDIQRATNATGMATEEGKKGVDSGVQLVARMGETIGQLSQVIDESAQSAMQMSAGGQQQTSGMEQIAVAMQNINQVTVQSMASTRQAEKSARELNDLARSLAEIVEQYQL
jgi:methyl-accepting chemotaxis protein